MPAVAAIPGIVLLLFGRMLFWVFVAGTGFLLGVDLVLEPVARRRASLTDAQIVPHSARRSAEFSPDSPRSCSFERAAEPRNYCGQPWLTRCAATSVSSKSSSIVQQCVSAIAATNATELSGSSTAAPEWSLPSNNLGRARDGPPL